MAGLKYSPLQHFFRGDATLLLLNSRSSPSHMKLPIAMPLLQTSIHSFLKINQSQSNFHFLVDVRAKNVYQSMASQGFSRKENIKKANCCNWCSIYGNSACANWSKWRYGKEWKRTIIMSVWSSCMGWGALCDFSPNNKTCTHTINISDT